MLAVFNLIPVPPLDGGTLLFRFLTPAGLARPAVPGPVRHVHCWRSVLLGGRFLFSFIYGVTLWLVG